jgi:hypothetical protein
MMIVASAHPMPQHRVIGHAIDTRHGRRDRTVGEVISEFARQVEIIA